MQAEQFSWSSSYLISNVSYIRLEQTTSKTTAGFQGLNPRVLQNTKANRDLHYILITQLSPHKCDSTWSFPFWFLGEQLRQWQGKRKTTIGAINRDFFLLNQAGNYTLSRMWNSAGIVWKTCYERWLRIGRNRSYVGNNMHLQAADRSHLSLLFFFNRKAASLAKLLLWICLHLTS